MTVGIVLEWLAAVVFVAAAFMWCGLILAMAVIGVCLFYFGQCYSGLRFPFRIRRHSE